MSIAALLEQQPQLGQETPPQQRQYSDEFWSKVQQEYESSQLAGPSFVDRARMRSYIRQGEIESGVRQKGFWEAQKGSWTSLAYNALKVPAYLFKDLGRTAADIKRESEWHRELQNYQKKRAMEPSDDPDAKWFSPAISQEELDKHREEWEKKTPLKVEVPDSAWAKIFNMPYDYVQAQLEMLYDNRPDLQEEPIEGVVDLISNPRKLVGAAVQSLPSLVTAGFLTAKGHPHMAYMLMFAAEGLPAYEAAIADGQSEEDASRAYRIHGLAAATLESMYLQHAIGFLRRMGRHVGAKQGRQALQAVVARDAAKKAAIHGEKSLTRGWLENAALNAAQEMGIGQSLEWTAKYVYGAEAEPGLLNWLDRRAIEATIAFAVSAPFGVPSVAIDAQGGQRARTRDAVARDMKTLRKFGEDVGLGRNEWDVPVVLNKSQRRIENFVYGVFGKRVAWYVPNADDAKQFNGWQVADTILLNANMADPLSAVALHEVTHAMQKESPQEYARLRDAVYQNLKDHEAVEADIRKLYDERGLEYDQAAIEAEVVADVIGRLATDQHFLNTVAGQAPNAIQKFHQSLMRPLKQALKSKDAREGEARARWVDPFIVNMADLTERTSAALRAYGIQTETLTPAEAESVAQSASAPAPAEPATPAQQAKYAYTALGIVHNKQAGQKVFPEPAVAHPPTQRYTGPEGPSEAKPVALKKKTKKTKEIVPRETKPEAETEPGRMTQKEQVDFWAKKQEAAEKLEAERKKLRETPPETKAEKGIAKRKLEELATDSARKLPIKPFQAIKRFGEILAQEGRITSPETLRSYVQTFKAFGGFLNALKIGDLNDVTPDVIRRYIRGLTHKGNKASTINQRLRVLNELFKRAESDGVIGKNPIDADMYLKEAQVLPKAKAQPTIQRIIDAIDPSKDRHGLRDRALFRFMADTGARRAEIENLQVRDLSTTARKVTLVGKGDKARVVNFGTATATAIEAYLRSRKSQTGLMFPSRTGMPLTGDAIYKLAAKYGDRVGIKMTPHMYRHSFATFMLSREVDLHTIKSWLGHADLKTTQQYLKVDPTALKKVVKEHHPRPSISRLPKSQQDIKATGKAAVNFRTDLQIDADSPNIRKGWILNDGTMAQVQRVEVGQAEYSKYGPVAWEHHRHAESLGMTLKGIINQGAVRASRFFSEGEPSVIAFELNIDNLTDTKLDAMAAFAAQGAIRGNNVVLVHATRGTKKGFGQVQYGLVSEAKGALNEAITAARRQLAGQPSITRKMTIKQAIGQQTGVRQLGREVRQQTDRSMLKFRLKAEQKAARIAYQQGWRDMRQKLDDLKQTHKAAHLVRKELIKWVKETIPPEHRGKMLSVINEARTDRTVQKAVDRIHQEIENVLKREQLKRLETFLKKFKKNYGFKKSGIYKAGARYKMAPEFSIEVEGKQVGRTGSHLFEQILDAITLKRPMTEEQRISLKELIEYAKQETEAAKADLLEGQTTEDNFFLANEIIPTLERLESEFQRQSVREFDADTLRDFNDSLETILAQWEWARNDNPQSWLVKERRRTTLVAANAIGEIQSSWKRGKTDAVRDVQTGRSPYKAKSFFGALFGRFNYNLQTMAYIVSGANKRTLYNEFGPALGHARDKQKSVVFRMQDLIREEMAKAGISTADIVRWSRPAQVRKRSLGKNIESWISRNAPEVIKPKVERPGLIELEIPLANGQTLRLSVGEALNIVMQARGNPFQYNALLKAGIVFRELPLQIHKLKAEDIQAIRDALPDNAKKMAKVLDLASNVMQENINAVSLEIDGYQRANIDAYWHLRRFREGKVKGKEARYGVETIDSRSHWQERVGGNQPIQVVDALNEFIDTVQVGAEYIGMALPIRRCKQILDNPILRNMAREKGYDDYWTDMMKQIEAIQDRKGEQDFVSRWYGKWIQNVTRAIFAFNLRVSAQQYASVFLATSDFGIHSLKHIRFKTDATLQSRIEKYSSFLRERFQGHINRELGDVAESGGVLRFYTGQDQLLNYPTYLVRLFDRLAIMDVWRMAEGEIRQEHNVTQAQLMASEKLMNKVCNRAEEVIRNTQPTWDVVDRSRIGSTRNPLTRSVTMFHSQREKLAQMFGIANSTLTNKLYQIKQTQQLGSIMEAATMTPEGRAAVAEASRTYGLILFNLALVKAWGLFYTSAIYGQPPEDPFEEWATSVVADIPGMFYFGEVGREVIVSWSAYMRGKPVRQMGAYELPPYRVLTTARMAAYESGKLALMTTGMRRATHKEVSDQWWKVLDRNWEAAQYMFGGPFLHPTTILKQRLKD